MQSTKNQRGNGAQKTGGRRQGDVSFVFSLKTGGRIFCLFVPPCFLSTDPFNDRFAAVDCCKKSVWLITPEGEQFDVKTPAGRYQGIARMLNVKEYEEPELFASCFEDEMVIYEYFSRSRRVA